MALFEYKCTECGYLFEELVGKNASTTVECKKCGKQAEKQVSRFSSVVSGGADNETIDMKIGREANKRWQDYHDQRAKRHGDRKLESVDLPKDKDGKYMPIMGLGDKGKKKEYTGALQEHREKRIKRGQPQFSGPGEF